MESLRRAERLKMTSDLQLGQFALATGPVFTFLALNQFLSVTLGFLQHESLSNPVLLARTQWLWAWGCWVSTHFPQGCRVGMHKRLRTEAPHLIDVAGLWVGIQQHVQPLTRILFQPLPHQAEVCVAKTC